jgi:hypothetical protein
MTIEHSSPTESTVKYLYAHAYRCAYRGCPRPLYREDEQTGQRTLNSRVCHIHARREGGPRWDASQTAGENRSERNLILLCTEHAAAIDDSTNWKAYPADLLRGWKTEQFEEYDKLKQGWNLDGGQIQEALRASFPDAIIVTESTLHLGGGGGNAPGAGGGGGGAIGRNARGGQGGPGGGSRNDDGEFTLPLTKDASRPLMISEDDLKRLVSYHPGAGGAGACAIGDNARAGDGGGGGEQIIGRIDIEALKKAGLDRIECEVGASVAGAHLPGQHGLRGADTIVNFRAKDGTILKTISAAGGAPARSASSYLPEGAIEISSNDIDNGFRITTLMAADNAEIREGLLSISGGGWSKFRVERLPTDAIWQVVCVAKWGVIEASAPRGVFLSLLDPSGYELACQALFIPAEGMQHGDRYWTTKIGAVLNAEGLWTLQVHSGGYLLSRITVNVELAPQKNGGADLPKT